MSVPDHIRESLRLRLHEEADAKQWTVLSSSDKSAHYEAWTRDPHVGGVLSRFISLSDVRVYLKDTLLKDYSRQKHADDAVVLRVVGLSAADVVKSYIKPHGRRFVDGKIVCWGRANAWKSVLMATFERAYRERNAQAFAAVLTTALGPYHQSGVREMIECAATKLAIERVVWLEQ